MYTLKKRHTFWQLYFACTDTVCIKSGKLIAETLSYKMHVIKEFCRLNSTQQLNIIVSTHNDVQVLNKKMT